jgi:hypothetical protein
LLGIGDDRVLIAPAETVGSSQDGPSRENLLDNGLLSPQFVTQFRVAKPHLIADDDGRVRKLVERLAHDTKPLTGRMIDLAVERIDLDDFADGKAIYIGGLIPLGGAEQSGLFHFVFLSVFGSSADSLMGFETVGLIVTFIE